MDSKDNASLETTSKKNGNLDEATRNEET